MTTGQGLDVNSNHETSEGNRPTREEEREQGKKQVEVEEKGDLSEDNT